MAVSSGLSPENLRDSLKITRPVSDAMGIATAPLDALPHAECPPILTIPLIVKANERCHSRQPVSFSIPFARAKVRPSCDFALVDFSNRHWPVQTRALALWPDQSIKWLYVDCILEPAVLRSLPLSFHCFTAAPKCCSPPVPRITIDSSTRSHIINTGGSLFTIDRRRNGLIRQVEVRGRPLLDERRSSVGLTGKLGDLQQILVQHSVLEEVGPIRTTIVSEGGFRSLKNQCRYVARLSFFVNESLLRIEFTVHNPQRAYHRGGLWDLGDRNSLIFRDLSLRFALAGTGPCVIQWIEDASDPCNSTLSDNLEIYQDSSGGENWDSLNHVNGKGQSTVQFRGYRVVHDGLEDYRLRANPIVSVSRDGHQITAGIVNFWQQFPKAIEVVDGQLNLRLFPWQSGALHELQPGEQKTHTVWLSLDNHEESGPLALQWIHSPIEVMCSPASYAESRALPVLSPLTRPLDQRYASYLSVFLDGSNSIESQREIIDEYGWRHFGDIYANHENDYFSGEKPIHSHYNNQYDQILGFLLQYLVSSDSKWLRYCISLAHHVMDIDIYHTRKDRSAYNGGLFWHTDHYRDASTATHRCYSRNNVGIERSGYGGGPSNEHNYTTGLLHYYYLTGKSQARESVLVLADWVLAMDDGQQTVLGRFDSGPTGLASSTVQSDFHGPGRGVGNSINALLDGFLLTQCRHYLLKAEELIRRAVHPNMNIAALNLLDVEQRWSYTMFLMVLMRYLDLKRDYGERDSMFDYACASLRHFASWMLVNEKPYYDQPEKLAFPTEAWAAHEFRKANVLRLAASFVSDAERLCWLNRGNELAERAWDDLMRCKSPYSARAMAIMLIEGHYDTYLRFGEVKDDTPYDGIAVNGPHEVFRSQKHRVLSELQSASGLRNTVLKFMRRR